MDKLGSFKGISGKYILVDIDGNKDLECLFISMTKSYSPLKEGDLLFVSYYQGTYYARPSYLVDVENEKILDEDEKLELQAKSYSDIAVECNSINSTSKEDTSINSEKGGDVLVAEKVNLNGAEGLNLNLDVTIQIPSGTTLGTTPAQGSPFVTTSPIEVSFTINSSGQ